MNATGSFLNGPKGRPLTARHPSPRQPQLLLTSTCSAGGTLESKRPIYGAAEGGNYGSDAAPDPELPVATPKPSSTTTTPAPPPVGGRGPHNETNDPDSTEDRVETTPPVEGEGEEKKVLQRSSTSPPRSVAATATPAVVSPPEATALVVIPALQLAPRRPDTARVSHPPTSSRPGSCRSVGTVVHRVPDAPPQAAHSIAIERKDKDYQRAAQDRLRAFTALTAATSTVPRKYHDRDTMHEDRQGYLAKDGLVHPSPRSTVKRESSRVPLALREQGVDIHHAGTLLTYLSSVYRQGIPSIPSRLERAADEHAKHSARELRRQKEQERILRREREALASASKQLEQFEENQKMAQQEDGIGSSSFTPSMSITSPVSGSPPAHTASFVKKVPGSESTASRRSESPATRGSPTSSSAPSSFHREGMLWRQSFQRELARHTALYEAIHNLTEPTLSSRLQRANTRYGSRRITPEDFYFLMSDVFTGTLVVSRTQSDCVFRALDVEQSGAVEDRELIGLLCALCFHDEETQRTQAAVHCKRLVEGRCPVSAFISMAEVHALVEGLMDVAEAKYKRERLQNDEDTVMSELQPLVGSDGRVPLTCFRNALVNAPLFSRVLNSMTAHGELPASSFQSFSPDPVRDILTVQRSREKAATETLRRVGSMVVGIAPRESLTSESLRNSPIDFRHGSGGGAFDGPDLTHVRFRADTFLSRRPPTMDPKEHDEPKWYSTNGVVWKKEGRRPPELIPL